MGGGAGIISCANSGWVSGGGLETIFRVCRLLLHRPPAVLLLSLFVKIFTLGGKEALGVKHPSMGHGKKPQTFAASFLALNAFISAVCCGFHREIARAFAVYKSVFITQGLNCHVSRKVEAIPGRVSETISDFPEFSLGGKFKCVGL